MFWLCRVRDAKERDEIGPRTRENEFEFLSTGDPNVLNPDNENIYGTEETTRICAMAQKMSLLFGSTESLMSGLPAEVRLADRGLKCRTGTELRAELFRFSEEEGVSSESLLEAVGRLVVQMENLQLEPYGRLTQILADMLKALKMGTPMEKDADMYLPHLFPEPGHPAFFVPYSFEEDSRFSFSSFLDDFRVKEETGFDDVGDAPDLGDNANTEGFDKVMKDIEKVFNLDNFFGGGGKGGAGGNGDDIDINGAPTVSSSASSTSTSETAATSTGSNVRIGSMSDWMATPDEERDVAQANREGMSWEKPAEMTQLTKAQDGGDNEDDDNIENVQILNIPAPESDEGVGDIRVDEIDKED